MFALTRTSFQLIFVQLGLQLILLMGFLLALLNERL